MEDLLKELGLSASTANMIIDYGTNILGALVLLALGFVVAGRAKGLVYRLLTKSSVDDTIAGFLASMARYAILIAAILGCLSMFGFDTTSFAAVLGGASVAIGLAFQGSLSNVAAGFMLLFFRPFDKGDVIKVAGQTGAVESIELFTTALTTVDNRFIIIPNSKIFGDIIENMTHLATRRVDISVGVDYDADIASTREALLEAIKPMVGEDHGILAEPEPAAVLTTLGDSSVNWQVRVWVDTGDYWAVMEQATIRVKEGLDAAAIGIPYPHQVVIHQNASEDEAA